jgi:hypothetical protein
LHRIWTPFPLMGKGRDRGAREPINQSPLPLSFPVEGKELARCRRLASSYVEHERSLNPFSKENTKDWENHYISISYFVLFARFVVIFALPSSASEAFKCEIFYKRP